MNAETIAHVIGNVHELEIGIGEIRRALEKEDLTASDRQYLERCFQLLEMEVGALRRFIAERNT